MKVLFKIVINEEYYLKCSIIDSENKEIEIKLKDQQTQEYNVPCITFDENKIFVCKNNEKTIHFVQKWIENPKDNTKYTVHFQNKIYQILPEVMFSLVISEFKKLAESHYIIEETILEIPSDSHLITERMKTSLESIGLKNITVNPNIFDYEQQGEYLSELFEKKLIFEEYQRKIERAKEINSSEEQKNKLEKSQKNIFSQETFYKEINNTFTLKERDELKLLTLDNYCIFIASRYLESLEDHLNLVKVSKRMRGNMDKFHYNPISLNEKTISFFPNVETLNIYEEGFKYLSGGRISMYIDWYNSVNYHQIDEIKHKNNIKEIEFKKVKWNKEDTLIELKKQNPNENENFEGEIVIPKNVNDIEGGSFSNKWLKRLSFTHSNVKSLKDIFGWGEYLTNLTLPLNESEIVYEDYIYSIPDFKIIMYIPRSVKLFNGEVFEIKNLTSLEIPSSVTSIENVHSFFELQEIVIPSTVKTITNHCIQFCSKLTNITLPLNENQMIIGNKIFKNQSHLEQDILLPDSIIIINGNEIDKSKIIIPTTVTSLDEDCFYFCFELKELTIPSTVKIIPKKCIEKCYKLTNVTLPLNENQMIIGNKIFNVLHLDQSYILPSSLKIINENEVNLSLFIIPSSVTSIDKKCFIKCFEIEQLVIPQTVIDIPFNALMILPKLQELILESKKFTVFQEKLLYVDNECLKSIELPTSIKKVNNQEVKSMETFTIPSNVTKISDYCFANCVNLHEINGLEHVKEFGKGCFYRCFEIIKDKYPEVEVNQEEFFTESISENHRYQLEEWTSLDCGDILFDTNIDNWSLHTSNIHERIFGKEQLVFLIEDTDGEIFVYYYNTRISNHFDYVAPKATDNETFLFNIQSNGRLNEPMKFEIKNRLFGGMYIRCETHPILIQLGCISLSKENVEGDSKCIELSDRFDFHGIDNAICGKSSRNNKCFTLKRLLIIQME